MSPPYIPLYIDDFLGDTVHLNGHEAGAYLLLLLAMWKSGGSLPDDDRLLARYAKLTLSQWMKVQDQVRPFFQPCRLDAGRLTQGRLRLEYAKYAKKVADTAKAGSLGGTAKAKNHRNALKYQDWLAAEASSGRSGGAQTLNASHANIEPGTLNYKGESISTDTLSPGADCGFEDFSRAYPKKEAIAAAVRDWNDALEAGAMPGEIMAGLHRYMAKWTAAGTAERFIPQAANWLKAKRWLDPIDEPEKAPQRRSWPGDPSLRAAVVAEKGEGFAASYLDQAEYRPPQTIIASTALAADRLSKIRAASGWIIEAPTGGRLS